MRKWAGYNKWKNYLLVIQLFSMFCDDIQDMDLTRALQHPMVLVVEHILILFADISHPS